MSDRLLSIPEAACRLGISRSSFYRLHRSEPDFPRLLRLGGAVRVSEVEVADFIALLAERCRAESMPGSAGVGDEGEDR